MRTWIVAYDFSEQAQLALERAAQHLTGTGGGKLLLLHVHQLARQPDGGIDLGLFGMAAQLDDAAIKQAEHDLARLAAAQREQHPTLVIETKVLTGHPADVIVAAATQLRADQIAVGSHGRHGVERFFIGSVAERIVRKAECSVLVVRRAA